MASLIQIWNGCDMTDSEIGDFVGLVVRGGAVGEPELVRRGLKRTGAMALLSRISGETVGVAARKVPKDSYRRGLEEKSGQGLPKGEYPFELGYVSVHPDYEGRGIGRELSEKAVGLSEGQGIFATTADSGMIRILSGLGFSCVGRSWPNPDRRELHLYIRKPG